MSQLDYEAQALTDEERRLVNRLFSNPLMLPRVFRAWLVSFLSLEVQITQGQVVSAAVEVLKGTGTPEGAQAAAVGSIFLRTDGAAGTTLYYKESGSGNTGWVQRDSFTNGLTISDAKNVTLGTTTGTKIGQATAKIGFFGATPVVKPSAYTQTYSTADKTLDFASASAFTGAADGEAKLADLNQLRLDVQDAVQTLNSLIDDLQALGLIG